MDDDFNPFDEGRDSEAQDMTMEEQMDELLRHIRDSRDAADNILAVGAIVAYTPETDVVDETGQPADGLIWRVINPAAHEQYDNIMQLLNDVDVFDEKVEQLKIRQERPSEIAAIGIGQMFDQ
jgi:hypothetical protein